MNRLLELWRRLYGEYVLRCVKYPTVVRFSTGTHFSMCIFFKTISRWGNVSYFNILLSRAPFCFQRNFCIFWVVAFTSSSTPHCLWTRLGQIKYRGAKITIQPHGLVVKYYSTDDEPNWIVSCVFSFCFRSDVLQCRCLVFFSSAGDVIYCMMLH